MANPISEQPRVIPQPVPNVVMPEKAAKGNAAFTINFDDEEEKTDFKVLNSRPQTAPASSSVIKAKDTVIIEKPVQMDLFVGISSYNPTGIRTNFPCGDAFIVYPGKDEPWLGMRLEAQRQGAEDVMLLKTLQEKHPEKAEALIGQVFESNTKYMEEPDKFETVYEELLRSLEDLR